MKADLTDLYHTLGMDAFKAFCYEKARDYDQACILDSCGSAQCVDYAFLCAFGSEEVFIDLENAKALLEGNAGWVFGVFGYDLKNQFEKLSSMNPDHLEFPEISLFKPRLVISIAVNGEMSIEYGEADDAFLTFSAAPESAIQVSGLPGEGKEEYLKKIRQIKELILDGMVYELNYCRESLFQTTSFDPIAFQQKLINQSPVPMAAFYKSGSHYLCCASMERFLKRTGNRIISQPIKGTIGRDPDPGTDTALKSKLANSLKDRAENVMIVDLVRNDLAKVCNPGTIKVTELFGIYPYKQVYQMVSTVEGELSPEVHLRAILEATFPMGSMTGTPKIAAMKHIERLEEFKRGWFSGTVGYLKPDGNFDLNVIIRSLFYNADKKLASYCTGGAITIDSDPDAEWMECRIKGSALDAVLLD